MKKMKRGGGFLHRFSSGFPSPRSLARTACSVALCAAIFLPNASRPPREGSRFLRNAIRHRHTCDNNSPTALDEDMAKYAYAPLSVVSFALRAFCATATAALGSSTPPRPPTHALGHCRVVAKQ